jgi:uncharacterized protein YciU (UPF0263 family)
MPIDDETVAKLLRAFELVFAERGAYRALAQKSSDWKEEFEILMADPEYRNGVSETIAGLGKSLASRQRLEEILRSMNFHDPN